MLINHSMEEVFRLCDLEPQHCQEVFMALEYSTAAEKSKKLSFAFWVLEPASIEMVMPEAESQL